MGFERDGLRCSKRQGRRRKRNVEGNAEWNTSIAGGEPRDSNTVEKPGKQAGAARKKGRTQGKESNSGIIRGGDQLPAKHSVQGDEKTIEKGGKGKQRKKGECDN